MPTCPHNSGLGRRKGAQGVEVGEGLLFMTLGFLPTLLSVEKQTKIHEQKANRTVRDTTKEIEKDNSHRKVLKSI